MKRTLLFALSLLVASPTLAQVRIKDIAGVQGARGNQLVGYGLVVGLDGSGDSNQALFTAQSVANSLLRFNINVPPALVKVRNVAAVMVTAELPAFVKNGSQIDITVSSIGDARSLQGGTLLRTPLLGPDGEVYAMGQGQLSIGGFNISAGGASAQKNHVSGGRIPGGARVEQEVPTSITDGKSIQITLKAADFTTASRIADAISEKLTGVTAIPLDAYSVQVSLPAEHKNNVVGFIAKLESITVVPDVAAKIVINERTGTVVIGGDVRINPCAIAHGSLQIKVENTPVVAIPAPFSGNGQPVVVPQKDVIVKEGRMKLASIPATTTVDQLVKSLNSLGVTPRDLIAIVQMMRAGGYISAEVVVE